MFAHKVKVMMCFLSILSYSTQYAINNTTNNPFTPPFKQSAKFLNDKENQEADSQLSDDSDTEEVLQTAVAFFINYSLINEPKNIKIEYLRANRVPEQKIPKALEAHKILSRALVMFKSGEIEFLIAYDRAKATLPANIMTKLDSELEKIEKASKRHSTYEALHAAINKMNPNNLTKNQTIDVMKKEKMYELAILQEFTAKTLLVHETLIRHNQQMR